MTILKPVNRKITRIAELEGSTDPEVLDDELLRLVAGGAPKTMCTCTGSTMCGGDEGVDYD